MYLILNRFSHSRARKAPPRALKRLQSYNFFLEYANFFVKKMRMEEKVVLLQSRLFDIVAREMEGR
jgi:hypothetical protein